MSGSAALSFLPQISAAMMYMHAKAHRNPMCLREVRGRSAKKKFQKVWFSRSCSANPQPLDLPLGRPRTLAHVLGVGKQALVAFRAAGDTDEVVRALYDQGVHVRQIPGTGLIRVSCGWWTSESDLERLLAALPA